MSVHRSRRSIAWSEFERQSLRVLRYTHQRMKHTPNRFQKYVCPKLYELASRGANSAVFANEQNAKDPEQLANRVWYIEDAISAFEEMQKPLWCYWNLLMYTDSSMKHWTDIVNHALELVCGVLNDKERMKALHMIRPLPTHQIQNARFLSRIAELQRYTYGKIVHEPLKYKDYILDRICDLVDDALFSAISGNENIPETKAEYETRKHYFYHALQCLNALQRPMFALWNVHMYSERVMQEWSDLIEESINLLQAVIKSDKDRFSSLE